MFGQHFYHSTVRKAVAVFGTLFNDINVLRTKADGSIISQLKVPLAYGPKAKMLARIDQATGSDSSMAIKLPRMGFEITSLELDSTQKLAKRNVIVESHASDATKKKTIKHQVAYNINVSLYILTKNQDDGLQIVEQILPYFQPEYNLTINPVSGFAYKQDVPIILTGVTMSDDYEGDFVTRRALIYQLDFTMKMKFFGPTGNQGVIRTVNIDLNGNSGGSDILEEMDFAITPSSADEDDNYTVTVTVT
jgi:dUTPase|tara:strand:+ start:3023 stop:3769 length:747 start_codon:yes stop_codon:yes gene_type:complete